jgi:hypothetical protein
LGGDLTLNLTGTTSVILPLTGTLSTLAGIETLTNKSMSGLDNTFTDIQYGSLDLSNSIVNADISPSAAIAYSKLALSASIVNSDVSPAAAIAYSKLALASSIVNADINPSAAIAYTKLNLANSITPSDLSPSFVIPYSNLNLTDSILNSDINSAAAIAYSKLALAGSIQSSDLVTDIIDDLLPSQSGNNGKFLTTDGSITSWASVGGVSGVAAFTADWTSGTTTVINHGLNTANVVVSVIDNQSDIVYVDIDVTDVDNITLTSSEAPSGTWKVVIHAEG